MTKHKAVAIALVCASMCVSCATSRLLSSQLGREESVFNKHESRPQLDKRAGNGVSGHNGSGREPNSRVISTLRPNRAGPIGYPDKRQPFVVDTNKLVTEIVTSYQEFQYQGVIRLTECLLALDESTRPQQVKALVMAGAAAFLLDKPVLARG